MKRQDCPCFLVAIRKGTLESSDAALTPDRQERTRHPFPLSRGDSPAEPWSCLPERKVTHNRHDRTRWPRVALRPPGRSLAVAPAAHVGFLRHGGSASRPCLGFRASQGSAEYLLSVTKTQDLSLGRKVTDALRTRTVLRTVGKRNCGWDTLTRSRPQAA